MISVTPDPDSLPTVEGVSVDLTTGRLCASLTDTSRGLNIPISTLTGWARQALIRTYQGGRGYDLEDCLKARELPRRRGRVKGRRNFETRTVTATV